MLQVDDFGALFEEFIAAKRDEMKTAFNRVLPTGELLFNRFDKAAYLQMGEGSSVYDTSVIMGDITVGDHVWIGPYTLIEGINGRVVIGDFVSINTGVTIYTHDSTKHYVSGGVNPIIQGDVTIGANTVIGGMSMICCGVTIGSHCVVGANSRVNRDVPDFIIVAGNPAKPIGRVQMEADGSVNFIYDKHGEPTE